MLSPLLKNICNIRGSSSLFATFAILRYVKHVCETANTHVADVFPIYICHVVDVFPIKPGNIQLTKLRTPRGRGTLGGSGQGRKRMRRRMARV